eukprot:scaffold16347_cov138-Isochrysis_galbana.AAC.2
MRIGGEALAILARCSRQPAKDEQCSSATTRAVLAEGIDRPPPTRGKLVHTCFALAQGVAPSAGSGRARRAIRVVCACSVPMRIASARGLATPPRWPAPKRALPNRTSSS